MASFAAVFKPDIGVYTKEKEWVRLSFIPFTLIGSTPGFAWKKLYQKLHINDVKGEFPCSGFMMHFLKPNLGKDTYRGKAESSPLSESIPDFGFKNCI